ncbi:MAG: transcriptional regulator [Gammaproteobacteria bacterium]|nr:MAG: transcriptional regulator [Gammaproteobacteria bacterium]
MPQITDAPANSFKRSACPLANSLEIFGDKWSLLIVRDIYFGKHRYNDFAQSPEKIPTNILAERLRKLISHGIIQKVPYQQRPVRYSYELTEKGEGLLPIIREIVNWGQSHIEGTRMMKRKQAEEVT